MTDLLDRVYEAHGGLDRWANADTVSAHFSFTGVFWGGRGWPGVFADVDAVVDTQREHIAMAPGGSSHRYVYDVAPDGAEVLSIFTGDGGVVESRHDPRPGFPSFVDHTWDEIQVAYFATVASWNYLNEPFLFSRDDIRSVELEPWEENGETWRRLAVRFPSHLPNHNPDQVFYFGDDYLLRRMDYRPEVASGPAAHYLYEPKEFNGVIAYTHREVYPRTPDGMALKDKGFITLDVDRVEVR